MREWPPENLRRVPGPKSLLYYLPRDPELQEAQVPLPRSTRTIWKILHKHQLIAERKEVKRQPLAPRQPLEEVQMDFKDIGARSKQRESARQEAARRPGMQFCGCRYLDAAPVPSE